MQGESDSLVRQVTSWLVIARRHFGFRLMVPGRQYPALVVAWRPLPMMYLAVLIQVSDKLWIKTNL